MARPLGILHVKDLALADPAVPPSAGQLKHLAHPGLEMREDLPLTEALARFPRHAHQMGIVVNGQGAWVGIVTVEDVVEQVIGEIDDEPDGNELPWSLADTLTPARIVLALRADLMREAIENIVGSIPDEALPVDAETIVRALTERAEQITPYLGEGVVVPHARLDGIDHPVLAFARSAEGVDFGVADQRAELFFLALSPKRGDRN